MRKLFFLFLIAFLSFCSCRFLGKRIHGNGQIKTVEKTVSAFKEVEVSGENIKLRITQGDLKPVKIEGDENILSYMEIIQEGDRIMIQPRNGVMLTPSADLNVFVTSPTFSSIQASGSCDIVGESKITSNGEISLETSGAGSITMELDAPKISSNISGAGSIKLKGQTKDLSIDISGVGHAYCYDLLTENTTISISGAGSAQVYASLKLSADLSGAGSINYKGNASVSQEISGAGSIHKAD